MSRSELVTLVLMLASGVALWLLAAGALPWLGLSLLLFSLVWLVSLPLRDASIVDIWWGPAQAALLMLSVAISPAVVTLGGWLVLLAVVVWAVRLAAHIAWRSHGQPEDFRYRKWREDWGQSFWWQSWLRVFVLQGVLAWMVAAPYYLAVHAGGPPTGLWLWLGLGIWLIGFLFEAIGDWQLLRFKADPDNKGRVLDSGLWGWTRHPNYFGEALLWWGLFIAVAPVVSPWWVLAPLLMTWLLMKVSGVALLEDGLTRRRSGYSDYQQRVPAFVPLPPAWQRTEQR